MRYRRNTARGNPAIPPRETLSFRLAPHERALVAAAALARMSRLTVFVRDAAIAAARRELQQTTPSFEDAVRDDLPVPQER